MKRTFSEAFRIGFARLEAERRLAQTGGVRTKDGEPPRFWVGYNQHGKPSPMTNVVNVSWQIKKSAWRTKCIVEGKEGKRTWHSVARHGSVERAFEAACEARRNVVDTAASTPSVVRVDPTTKTLVVDKCTYSSCFKPNVPIAEFAPDPLNTLDAFERFGVAMVIASDPDVTDEERAEAVAAMEALRTQKCVHCREVNNRTHNTGAHNLRAACKAMAAKIRADLATRACTKCGQCCGRAMQCEHPGRVDKLGDVLDPSKWHTPERGPEAMWNEYKTKTVPMCTFCHYLEPTHSKSRGADSTTMPTTTYREKQAKLQCRYKEQRNAINVGWKAGKSCIHCGRKVQPGKEHAFHWMHSVKKMVTDRTAQGLPRLYKSFTIGILQNSAICPATFKRRAWPEIEAKCELGCGNCHMIHETLPELAAQAGRLKQFVAEWAERGGVTVP